MNNNSTPWPDLTFPPINLWNFPKQYKDFLAEVPKPANN